MSDKEIEDSIYIDLLATSSQNPIASLADLLEDEDDDSLEAQLLMTIVDQNKILIRQNELILRALKRRSLPP